MLKSSPWHAHPVQSQSDSGNWSMSGDQTNAGSGRGPKTGVDTATSKSLWEKVVDATGKHLLWHGNWQTVSLFPKGTTSTTLSVTTHRAAIRLIFNRSSPESTIAVASGLKSAASEGTSIGTMSSGWCTRQMGTLTGTAGCVGEKTAAPLMRAGELLSDYVGVTP